MGLMYLLIKEMELWEAFSKGLPAVAVHDIVIQPKLKIYF